jgi:asparagine synthase (glutamine-hydrolysing)
MTPFLEIDHLKELLHSDFEKEIDYNQEWFLEKYYIKKLSPPKDLQILDLQTVLPEQYLTKVDRASMAHSLEVRVPMLDVPLVEFMISLPVSIYAKNAEQKYLLKELMKNHLPENIIYRKKRGFSVPLAEFWNKHKLADYIFQGSGIKTHVLSKAYVNSLITNGSRESLHHLWQIAVFTAWSNIWL